MIRVLIVDDQELLRRGIRMLLETVAGIEVVGEAEDGNHALALIPSLSPDVVLSDARMPGLDGVGLVTRAAQHHPGLPVLVLTTFDDAPLVRAALDAGASGFLMKDVSVDALADAIRQVCAGGVVIDPRVARTALGAPSSTSPTLTETERAVGELIARGLPNSEIADHLHLAHGTVKNAVSQLLKKHEVRDRTALALLLARHLQ